VRPFRLTLLVAATLAGLTGAPGAADLDPSRFTFGVRGGGAFLLDSRIAPGVDASDGRAFGAALGMRFTPHLGVEVGLDYLEFERLALRGQRIGEYSIFSVIPALRARYPLLDGRIAPYALAGAGALFTGFNDRKPPGIGVSVDASGAAAAGVLGVGLDAFVADNVSFGLEARWLYANGPPLEIDGRKSHADISALTATLSLRVLLPGSPPPPAAADGPWPRRAYLQIRAGGAAPAQKSIASQLEGHPEHSGLGPFSQLFGIAIGVDLARYVSVELSSDGWEINVERRGVGLISEYSVQTGMVVGRLRYPVLDDRLIPFLIGGVGLAYAESNDIKPRGVPLGVDGNTGFVPTGAIGLGVDYMIARNVAVGVESKYVFVRGHELTIDGRTRALTLDAILTSGTMRIFFP
jgi:opacity protein-like surface antigen